MTKREDWERRLRKDSGLIGHAPYEIILSNIMAALEFLVNANVESDPPNGKKKVTNFYVEMVEGSPKLRVEYEE